MSNDWYYAEGDETKGPVNMAELKEKLATKQLPADTLVWSEGMDDWVPATTRTEFQFTAPPRMAHPASAAKPAPAKPAAAADEEPEDTDDGEEEDESLEGFDSLLKTVRHVEVDPEDARKYKIIAIIGYFWVLFILPLLFARKSRFARFHANQSLILFILGTFWWMVVGMMLTVAQLGFAGDWMGYLVGSMFVVPFIFSILGMVNAGKGLAKPLPIIGRFTILPV